MHLARLRVRDVRTYEAADVELGPGLTVIAGANGAGKTNLLEAAYLACTGRSFRGAGDRELVRRGAVAANATTDVRGRSGSVTLSVGIEPGERRRLLVDGSAVETLLDHPSRPRLSVFLPDRLALVKGGPALRRAHLDQLMVALHPSTAALRRGFHEALRQRNVLLAGLRVRGASVAAAGLELEPWDRALALAAAPLVAARAQAVAELDPAVTERAEALGLAGRLELVYRPRSASDPDAIRAALAERRDADLGRGFTHHGPHRDDLAVRRDGRALGRYGSQGEQRLAVLALLLGEADVLADTRGERPVLLLDDVTSELDMGRRDRLVETLIGSGQALLTVTEADHVPGSDDAAVGAITVTPGRAVAVRVAAGRGRSTAW